MPKARELNDVEKFYIDNNPQKSDEEIASQISGVGPKTVAKYRESVPVEEKDTGHIEETQKERTDRLAKGPKSGELLSRREGVAIMTQQASEVLDARRVVMGKTISDEELEGRNKDKIHRPKN